MRNSKLIENLRKESAEILQEISFLKRAIRESEGPELDLKERLETLNLFMTKIVFKIEELK